MIDRYGSGGSTAPEQSQSSESCKWQDTDELLELSGWEEETDGVPPPNDESYARKAGDLQAQISDHTPIDTDTGWEEVAPRTARSQRPPPLPPFPWISRRSNRFANLFLRHSGTAESQMQPIVHQLGTESGCCLHGGADLEACLRLLLGDMGVVIDEDDFVLERSIDANTDDEADFGSEASEGLAFLSQLQTNHADPFVQYMRELFCRPTDPGG